MPKFLEDKLKSEYGTDSAIPYKVMNSIGAMKGNRETAKGAAMERKHQAKNAAARPSVRMPRKRIMNAAAKYAG